MSCVRVPREYTSSLENYMKSRPHFFLSGLRPNRSEGRAVRKEGEDSFMSVEDEFEETRRALHRMLKDAFEGKLGVFREPFIYGFTTRSHEERLETPRPALEGEEIRRAQHTMKENTVDRLKAERKFERIRAKLAGKIERVQPKIKALTNRVSEHKE